MQRLRLRPRGALVAAFCLSLIVAAPGRSSPIPANLPAISACLARQLQVTVTAHVLHSTYDRHRHPDQYETNINVFAFNISPVPCLLLGSPTVTLVHNGHVVPVPYQPGPQYQTSPTGALGLVSDLPSQILIPGDYAHLGAYWQAPYCGKRIWAALDIALATEQVLTAQSVPSPPCRKGWPELFSSDNWLIFSPNRHI